MQSDRHLVTGEIHREEEGTLQLVWKFSRERPGSGAEPLQRKVENLLRSSWTHSVVQKKSQVPVTDEKSKTLLQARIPVLGYKAMLISGCLCTSVCHGKGGWSWT